MLDGIAPGADTQPADPAPESMAVIFGNAMFERPCRRPRAHIWGRMLRFGAIGIATMTVLVPGVALIRNTTAHDW